MSRKLDKKYVSRSTSEIALRGEAASVVMKRERRQPRERASEDEDPPEGRERRLVSCTFVDMCSRTFV